MDSNKVILKMIGVEVSGLLIALFAVLYLKLELPLREFLLAAAAIVLLFTAYNLMAGAIVARFDLLGIGGVDRGRVMQGPKPVPPPPSRPDDSLFVRTSRGEGLVFKHNRVDGFYGIVTAECSRCGMGFYSVDSVVCHVSAGCAPTKTP